MRPFFDIKARYRAYKSEIDVKIQEVLESGQFIMGPHVQELEKQLERYTGATHCITCANGTDALQIALMAIGIRAGDEVITTPFSFFATAEVILLLGAKPVFVDVEEESFLINARLISEKITPKTKAILPVSLYGQVPDMEAIHLIAQEGSHRLGHKIYVIEDAAQSFGAEYKGKKSCHVSDIATTSFFPTKTLGCYGDGGALFTSSEDLATAMHEIRNHGQKGRDDYRRIGVNSRLDTIQAAVLLVKLQYLDDEIALRRERAREYTRYYRDRHVVTPKEEQDRKHAYGLYTVRVKDRPAFQAGLKEQGIPTAVYYPVPLNKQPVFKNNPADCPRADTLASEVISLPIELYPSSSLPGEEGKRSIKDLLKIR